MRDHKPLCRNLLLGFIGGDPMLPPDEHPAFLDTVGPVLPAGWARARGMLACFVLAWAGVFGDLARANPGPGLLVGTNAVWAYRKGTAEATAPTAAWRATAYDDSGWLRGAGPFYYDADGSYTGSTRLDDMRNGYTSFFLRHAFVAQGVSAMGTLRLGFLCDDGFVLWINGTLATNFNKNPADVGFATTAAGNVAEPLEWREYVLASPSAWLRDGTNVLAVQVFNSSRTSSDMVFALGVSATVRDASPPSVARVEPPPGTVGDLRTVTVQFSEPVQGVGFSDLWVNARPAVSVSGGGDRYTFTVEVPGSGPVEVGWDPGAGIIDYADPPNRFDPAGPGATWRYTVVDGVPPRVVDVTPLPDTTIRALTRVEVRFQEPVAGVDAGDLQVGGREAVSVTGTGAGPYVFEVPDPGPGVVQAGWVAGHGIRDLANPSNAFGGGTWRYTVDPSLVRRPVLISEILAAHVGVAGLRDEDDEVQDWVELENRGEEEVNLRGWSLTDDPDDPGRWVFPEVRLSPGGFLLVFASGKDRRPTSPGRLHANFKLAGGGGYLGLYDGESPRGVVAEFRPGYPGQRGDVSYGYDVEGQLRYFGIPTPGRANGTSLIGGALPEVDFSVSRGVFERGFDLVLSSAVPGAEIRYTTDGNDPGATGASVYRGPLRVETTAVVRAAAYRSGSLPSPVSTHTYVFPAHAARQPSAPPGVPGQWVDTQGRSWTADYEMDPEIVEAPEYRDRVVPALKALPVLSIVTRPQDMFDNATGIYPKSQGRGPSWERPASAEIVDWERGEAVQADCGVQMQGNSVRDPVKTGKHAFRLVFKGAYGPAKLRYRVFPDSPVEAYDTLTVRADFNNSWMHWNGAQRPRGQRVRDAWMKESQRAMGGLASRSRFFHLYVNGLYWGVYDAVERPDAAFAAAHYGGEKEDFDVVNEGQLVDGSMAAYNEMRALTGLETTAGYERMKAYLDLPAYIDYVLLHFYTGHEDWFTDKNWYVTRRRVAGAGFRYHAWDGELMLNAPTQNIVTRTDQPTGLHAKLMANPQYRLDFADRVQRHFFGDGALTPAAAAARYERWAALVEPAMVAESARWGDYRRDVHAYQSGPYELYTVDGHFRAERERLRTEYFPVRTALVLGQLKAAGLYPAAAVAPVFSQAGGRVAPGFRLGMSLPGGNGSIFYTTDGSDPRMAPAGSVAPSAREHAGPIEVGNSMLVRARSRAGAEWSALAEARFDVGVPGLSLDFSEIHYHPALGDPYEFVEIQNRGVLPVDLDGFSLEGVAYRFPPGGVLEPGRTWVVASGLSPTAFATRYPGVTVHGWFDGALSDAGERVALLDRDGRTVVSVEYGDDDGWPREADGRGPSLERIDFAGDPDAPASWRRSATTDGTPGRATEPEPVPGGVRLSEVLSAPVDSGTDWIEIENAGGVAADVGGWTIADAGGAAVFTVPAGTRLQPGERRLVWCRGASPSDPPVPGRWEAAFGLSAEEETVILSDASGTRRDAVSTGILPAGFSLGRFGETGDWVLGEPTPEGPNRAVALAAAESVRLNEWLANPVPGGDDWIELFNSDLARPAALQGCWLSAGGTVTRYSARSFVAPGGFVVLRADERPGATHLDLKLPAAGATLEWFDATGRAVDRGAYGLQAEGVSSGRWPDGGSAIQSFPGTASPGMGNHVSAYAGPRWNEILVVPAESGSPAWVELHHAGTESWPLEGMRVSNRIDGSGGWEFPAGSTVPAGGFVVLELDPTRPAGSLGTARWNTGLALTAEGGRVHLMERSGRRVDGVEFGFQVRGLPLGRTGAEWTLLRGASPGAANLGASELGSARDLRLNEWTAGTSIGEDWIELFNRGPRPVELSGLVLTDHPGLSGRPPWRFAPGSYIGGGGFVRVLADGREGAGPDHAGFRLAAGGDSIQLSDGTGPWIDAVSFGRLAAGVSQGRLPDGADGAWVLFDRPTPGRGNTTLPEPAAPSLGALGREGSRVRFVVRGAVGPLYRVQSSADLVTWKERRMERPAAMPWEVELEEEPTLPAGYFRVVMEP